MKKFTLVFAIILGFAVGANASSFKLNQDKFEAAFEQSEDLTNQLFVSSGSALAETFASSASEDSMDKQTLAAIICVVEYFTGVGILIPIHRIILGCDGQTVKVVALYCITLGGLGWLPLIDAIFLFMDDTKSKYIENGKFLMFL